MTARRWTPWAAVAAITLLAVLLRAQALGSESIYFDEFASTQHLAQPDTVSYLRAVRTTDPPMTPVYFALQYAWSRVFSPEISALRWLPLLFNAACIPLIFVLGRTLFNGAAGLLSAAVFAVALPPIYYAQELRPYSMALFFACVSMLSLWTAIRHGRRDAWAINIAANSLLLFMHLFTCWFLLAQGVYLFVWAALHRRWIAPCLWGVAHLPALAPLGLWLSTLDLAALEAAAGWREEIVHNHLPLLGDFLQAAGAGVPMFSDIEIVPGFGYGALLWRVFALLFFAIIGLALFSLRNHSAKQIAASPAVFLLVLFVAPIAAQFLFSALVYSCHASRYVLYTILPFVLLLGGFLQLLTERETTARGKVTLPANPPPRRPFAFTLASLRVSYVCLLAVIYVLGLALHPRPFRADLQGAAEYISARLQSPAESIAVRTPWDIPVMLSLVHPALDRCAITGVYDFDTIPGELPAELRWLVVNAYRATARDLDALAAALEAAGRHCERIRLGTVRPVDVYRMRR